MSDWYCQELLTGNTPVERVFEDESVVAYWHTRPHYAHHVVVTPRYHIESLLECDTGTLTSLLEVVKAIGAQFIAEYGGAHVVTNLGEYQDSKHLHFHIGAD
ncbi:MAG: HIT domain-containing protein [Tepidiformaceae bacterium]